MRILPRLKENGFEMLVLESEFTVTTVPEKSVYVQSILVDVL